MLRLLALGLTHAEIAERLVISRKTARNHVEHIYQKIGVSSRALASLFAVRHGLIGLLNAKMGHMPHSPPSSVS